MGTNSTVVKIGMYNTYHCFVFIATTTSCFSPPSMSPSTQGYSFFAFHTTPDTAGFQIIRRHYACRELLRAGQQR